MKNRNRLTLSLPALAFGLFALTAVGTMAQASPNAGEAEFKEYCAACHADGGNLINPAKTLSKTDREMNGIKSHSDIIKLMRAPGEGMSTFDEKMLPEAEAKKIAEYITNTFK